MIELPGKVVSISEILQAYIRLYVEASYLLGLAGTAEAIPTGIAPISAQPLYQCLVKLRSECEKLEAVCAIEAIVSAYALRIVAAGLLLFMPAVLSATSLVLVIDRGSIFLGADSLASSYDASIAPVHICKTYVVGSCVFAWTGIWQKPETDFNVWTLAVAACKKASTVSQAAELFMGSVEDPLRRTLDYYRRHEPVVFKKSTEGGKPVLETIFAGFQGNRPIAIAVGFIYDAASGLKRRSPLIMPDESGNDTIIGGTHDAIDAYIAANRRWRVVDDVPALIERLITLEVTDRPDAVGPPISIIGIQPNTYRWVEAGGCADQQVPPNEK